MLCNILLDKLPHTTPNGFKIKYNYKQGIKFELLMQDNTLDKDEKVKLALNIFYYKKDLQQIKNVEEIKNRINDIIWFYKCGKDEKTSQNNENRREKQIYSYEFDADKIYSAFIQQYNKDLQKENLHWWQFRSMFESLTSETQIVEIMGYRAMDLSKIKDKEERKRYRKLQRIYALPDMRTQEQKESDFACAFL